MTSMFISTHLYSLVKAYQSGRPARRPSTLGAGWPPCPPAAPSSGSCICTPGAPTPEAGSSENHEYFVCAEKDLYCRRHTNGLTWPAIVIISNLYYVSSPLFQCCYLGCTVLYRHLMVFHIWMPKYWSTVQAGPPGPPPPPPPRKYCRGGREREG